MGSTAIGCVSTSPAIRRPLFAPIGVDSFAYRLRSVSDLHAMLLGHGWVELGAKDEKGTPAEGTVEAWGSIARQSRWRLVWTETRMERSVRYVRAATLGVLRPRGA